MLGKLVSELPVVSVVMPVRNEGAAIEVSLGSVLALDWPADRLEVLIADGASTDTTRERIARIAASARCPVLVVDNPRRIVSTGLNLALEQARGEVVLRVDGHCEVAPDTLRRAVVLLDAQSEVGAVGGVLETIGEGFWGRTIATAMASRFGVGGSAFRVGVATPRTTDTVAFPTYRREALAAAGAFDEELVRNQDDEYSYRLRHLGWSIVLDPAIRATYRSRPTLRRTFSQLFQYGWWKVRVLQKHPRQMRWRQFVPPSFVAAVLATLLVLPWTGWPLVLLAAAWLGAATVASAIDGRRLGLAAVALPLAYLTLHLGYGLGFLAGLVRFVGRWGDRVGREPANWKLDHG